MPGFFGITDTVLMILCYFWAKIKYMSLLQFFKSRRFFIHLAIFVGTMTIGLLMIMLSLRSYTRQGKTIAVPLLKGYVEQQTAEPLKKLNLRYTIIDSIHNPDVAPGVIVEQIPAGGSKVKKNRMIFITINAFSAEQVKMPLLVDYSLRNATVLIESSGLKIGHINYVPNEYANLVLGQKHNGRNIEAGKFLPKGSYIDLTVGQGLGSEQVAVPDIIGLTLDEARHFLSSGTGLTIGAIVADETVKTKSDSLIAIIYKQTPTANPTAFVSQGSAISVWISTNMDMVISGMEERIIDEEKDDSDPE